jgi:Domain of unknown function (DUF4260)
MAVFTQKICFKLLIMKLIIKLEEAAMTAVAIYFLSVYNLGLPVWVWVLLFFSPDISMLGYLVNTKWGAVSYNLFHHKGIALLLAAAGYYVGNTVLVAIGILLFAHASFDRIWGYGLKYPDNFKNTHLGSLE